MILSTEEIAELKKMGTATIGKLEASIGNMSGDFDPASVSNLASEAEVAALKAASGALLKLKNLNVPQEALAAATLAILIGAVAGALAPMALAVSSKEQRTRLKDAGPEAVTRDQMLFAALFAIASETLTDEGKNDMVHSAAAYVDGDSNAFPSKVAHHQFQMIRGYRFDANSALD